MSFNRLTLVGFMVVLASQGPALAQDSCPAGAVAYYPLDETVAGNYGDVINSNDGSCTANCPDPATPGAVDGAQSFVRANGDRIDVPDDGSFDFGPADSFSIEAWINKSTACTGSGLSVFNEVAVGRADGNLQWWIGVFCRNVADQGKVRAILQADDADNVALLGTTNTIDGQWHHLVLVRNGATGALRLFVDGVQEANTTHTYVGSFSGTTPLNIGYQNLVTPGFHFNGGIDEVAIYDVALTAADVLDHYDAGLLGLGICACRVDADCNDGIACTVDSCTVATGECAFAPDDAVCDDGVYCNGAEVCAAESGCLAGLPVDCDDSVACTVDTCVELSMSCDHAPDDGLCDDSNVCTDDSCDVGGGTCVNTPNTASCDDGDACTHSDACMAGVCAGTAMVCNDNNPCTDDSCSDGMCVFVSNMAPCDDGNECTSNDGCANGLCLGTTVRDGTACDDGNDCTEFDGCVAGVCGGQPLDCDDNDPCTNDGCLNGRCVYANNTASCDDGDACTENDVCAAGACTGTPLVCDDIDGCTDDACVGGMCVFTPNTAPCDDGNACTEDDTCDAGLCAGAPLDCDDANVCTDDGCDDGLCTHDANTDPCDDGDACTESDVCAAGSCGGVAVLCDDGVFCNGAEGCDALLGCQPGSDPCPSQVCVEAAGGCCDDDDGDSVCNAVDICPGFDDAVDGDADGVPDGCDNCPLLANAGQEDCDTDLTGDACAIADGSSLDCNGNSLPDECENDCNCNGVDDLVDVAAQTSLDCDGDEIPDECSGLLVAADSGVLGPIGDGSPQSFVMTDAPPAGSAVTFTVFAVGDLEADLEFVVVEVNGTALGTVLELTGTECPPAPDSDTLVVSAAAFNAALIAGPTVIGVSAPPTVDAALCPAGEVRITVSYAASTAADCNGNLIPDGCELAGGSAFDCDGNRVLDGCDLAGGAPDCDDNGVPDVCQSDCDGNGIPSTCEPDCCAAAVDCADFDGNGVRDDSCLWWACGGSICSSQVTPFADVGGAFGACPPDTFANVHDVNHVLGCFASVSTCAGVNIDAGGPFGLCPSDGFCNVHDVNHVLGTFTGTSTCSCDTGPAPAAPIVAAGVTALRVVPRQAALIPGEKLQVDVVVDRDIKSLLGYQLEIEAFGGRTGRLTLVDVAIPNRSGRAFGNLPAHEASNVYTGQVLRYLSDPDSPGVAVAADAHLATFTFEASADISGTFTISVSDEGGTALIAPGPAPVDIGAIQSAILTVGTSR